MRERTLPPGYSTLRTIGSRRAPHSPGGPSTIPAHAAPHVPGALAQAEAITPPNGIIVATGSIFLIGELRALALAETVA